MLDACMQIKYFGFSILLYGLASHMPKVLL